MAFYHGEMPTHNCLARANTGYVGVTPTKTPWFLFRRIWQGLAFAHIRNPTSASRPMVAFSWGGLLPPSFLGKVHQEHKARLPPRPLTRTAKRTPPSSCSSSDTRRPWGQE
ncbi:unnamed protein product [Parnassius mnemosyne]|uniref:Uncharacterized protein n=1 Tax=Parnassius mnemosyne TaxID=213953 RepID=A0AAV1LWU1_9NEOP